MQDRFFQRMTQMRGLKSYLLFAVLSALLVLLGDTLVLQRSLNGPTQELTIRSDALSYLRMAEEDFLNVPGLYKCRMLVPFIARLLPFSAMTDFAVISYTSLFVSYFFAFLICAELGFSWLVSLLALFSVYSSRLNLYYYHNPYLTDPFGLMVLFVQLFCLMKRSYIAFVTMSILGMLARETSIFLVPLWVITKQWRKSMVVMVAAVVAPLLPLVILAWPIDLLSIAAYAPIDRMTDLFICLMEIFLSWGFLWFLALLGIFFIPFERIPLVGGAFALLFLGAFLPQVFYAKSNLGETGRFFSVLSPVMVIACAQLYSVLSKKSTVLTLLLLPLLVAQLFSGIPTVITPRGGWVFRDVHYHELFSKIPAPLSAKARWILDAYLPRLFVLAAGICLSIATAWILHDQLSLQLQEKVVGIRSALKRKRSRDGNPSP